MGEAEKTGPLGSAIKIIGLIGTSVAITLGVTNLVKIYHTENPASKLEMLVDCQQFDLPPSAVRQLDDLREAIRSDVFEKLVMSEFTKFKLIDIALAEEHAKNALPNGASDLEIANEKLKEIDTGDEYVKGVFIRELTSSIRDYNEKLWSHDYRYNTPHKGTMIVCKLHNGGSLVAEDVTIDLPFSGEARTADEDQAIKTFTLGGGIKVGSLRPTKDFVVQVWSKDSLFSVDQNSIVVSSKSGTGSVRLSPDFKAAALIHDLPGLGDLFIPLGIFLSVPIIASLYILVRLRLSLFSRIKPAEVVRTQIAEGTIKNDSSERRSSDSEVSI